MDYSLFMPGRSHPLHTGNIYHVYNRIIDKKPIFNNASYTAQFKRIIHYYRSKDAKLRYSCFRKLAPSLKEKYESIITNPLTFRISVFAYTIMPTHYHLLLRQNHEKGISTFISQIQNSFTRFYNVVNKRSGPIFIHKFKSKPITNDKMGKHVSRYIHLNLYSNGLICEKENLFRDKRTSLYEYIQYEKFICDTEWLTELFSYNMARFKKFIMDQADYQKTLEICKYAHLHL